MPKIDVAAAKERASQLFAGFTSGQKTMLALAAVATLAAGFLFVRVSGGTEYAPLYTNLTAQSASEVTAALDSAGVDYRLADGGSTIQVARPDVYRTRVDLSASGLPRDGAPGYDLLDEQGITTSEFRQRIDLQRAMEGELARTLQAIDGVERAIVHLVMPRDDLFTGDAQHPSASVLLSTDPNRPIGAGQVQAVVHLVASSVEGLQAEHVTVADNSGRVLSATGPEGAVAAAGDARASQTAAFESAVASRIQEMIVPVTGPNRSRVVVNADLDFDRRSTTREEFGEPGTAPVVQESVSTETFEGNGGNQVGGVLGPDGLPINPDAAGANTYQRENTDRIYANEKITEVVENAPGDVRRLSVAVLLDEAAGVDLRAVEQLVTTGAGIDVARGDAIEVTQLPFDTSAAEDAAAALEAARSAEAQGQLVGLLRTVAAVVIVAVVLFFAWRSHRKAAVARYPVALPVADPDDRGLPSGNEPTMAVAVLDDEQLEALQAAPAPADDAQRDALQNQITDLIDRQPEDVASVLRTWMAER